MKDTKYIKVPLNLRGVKNRNLIETVLYISLKSTEGYLVTTDSKGFLQLKVDKNGPVRRALNRDNAIPNISKALKLCATEEHFEWSANNPNIVKALSGFTFSYSVADCYYTYSVLKRKKVQPIVKTKFYNWFSRFYKDFALFFRGNATIYIQNKMICVNIIESKMQKIMKNSVLKDEYESENLWLLGRIEDITDISANIEPFGTISLYDDFETLVDNDLLRERLNRLYYVIFGCRNSVLMFY